jgi:hypothetical protein
MQILNRISMQLFVFSSIILNYNLQQIYFVFKCAQYKEELKVALCSAHPAGILAGVRQGSRRRHWQRWRQGHEAAGSKRPAATGQWGCRAWRRGSQAKVVARVVDGRWWQVGGDGHGAHILVALALRLAPPNKMK